MVGSRGASCSKMQKKKRARSKKLGWVKFEALGKRKVERQENRKAVRRRWLCRVLPPYQTCFV